MNRRELYAAGEPFGSSATRAEYGKKRIYGGGGSGDGKTTTTSPTIPNEFKPLANLYTKQATQYAATPYQAYTGQRNADLNQTQNAGIGMVQQRAIGGDQTMNAGGDFLQGQLSSGPNGATANPFGMVNAGMNNSTVTPGMNNATINPGQNQYAGPNQYLDDAVSRAQSSVVDKFNMMTKPQLETAMRNSGSFGNSGLQQMMQQEQESAGQQLGDIASQMYMQDYGNQQQLAEAGLNRSMSAQQFNSGVTDANIGRDMQAQQFNSGLTDANLGRDMQAQQFNAQMGQDWAGRNDNALNNWRSSNLQAAQLAPTYGNAAYQDASQLLNAGNIQQQQQQNNLDFGYQQFSEARDYPLKQMSATSGVLGQNMGSTATGSGGGGGK